MRERAHGHISVFNQEYLVVVLGDRSRNHSGERYGMFRKYVTTALAAYLVIGSISGIPLAVGAETQISPVTAEGVADSGVSVAHQTSGFVLLNEKKVGNSITGGTSGGLAGFEALSPALLLFGGAIGAIFWLGRQRNPDNSNWE